jgi:streptogramin lyase
MKQKQFRTDIFGLTFLSVVRALWLLTAVALSVGLCTLGSAYAQSLVENFDDNAINSSLWLAYIYGAGPTITEANQRLEVVIPASSTGTPLGAGYYSICTVSGDFDIQVDYELLTWPTTSGVRVGLVTLGCLNNPQNVSNVERVSLYPSEFVGFPREIYVTDFSDGAQGITGTSDLSGTLRLVRAVNSVTGYYRSPDKWISIHSASVTTADLTFGMLSWSGDAYFSDKEVRVAFDNFVMNAGQITCPPYAFVGKWGSGGTGDGQFNTPGGLALDGEGNLYVADVRNNRVQKFDSKGTFLRKWGSYGPGDGQFAYPQDVAVDSSGNVYVADGAQNINNRVQKFDSEGDFLKNWGSLGTAEGQFNAVRGVTVDAQDHVYVTDAGNCRIQKFDSGGGFLGKWGSCGTGVGQFNNPFGIDVSSEGDVYVAEFNNNRIQRFDGDGLPRGMWGSNGSGNSQFVNPSRAEVDSMGNVYVTDTDNHRVQKFDAQGNFIAKWGSYGSCDGQFNEIYGIAVRSPRVVYVADHWNHRIQKFALGAPFINVNPQVLDFGAVAIGEPASAMIENKGLTDLRVSAITRCTGTSTEFAWSPAPPFMVTPGRATTLTVTYEPSGAGADNGCLEISSDDPITPVIILGVSGNGQPVAYLGDINGDGAVDISDVILVLRIALKLDPVTACSDINNDGSVDISDVILTLRMALLLDPLESCTG